jgi:hypothetical protein
MARARLPIYPVVKTLDSRAEFTHGLANVSQPMAQKFSVSASVIPSQRIVNDGGILTTDD